MNTKHSSLADAFMSEERLEQLTNEYKIRAKDVAVVKYLYGIFPNFTYEQVNKMFYDNKEDFDATFNALGITEANRIIFKKNEDEVKDGVEIIRIDIGECSTKDGMYKAINTMNVVNKLTKHENNKKYKIMLNTGCNTALRTTLRNYLKRRNYAFKEFPMSIFNVSL